PLLQIDPPPRRLLPIGRAARLAQPGRERITLVAGDGDYEPMVRQLVQDGFEVTLLYWAHASRELQAVASRFYPLDDDLEDLALR
ncbi:NYN domain-containing protein, partial [Roseomonas marmotae]